jgi:hypothetical protein
LDLWIISFVEAFMNWTAWIIPLIALAVWVISNLAKNAQEQQRRPNRPTPGTPPANPNAPEASGPKPQRTAAEIEDFLREVRRRREVADGKKTKKVIPPPPPPRPVQPVRSRPSLEAPIPMAVPIRPDRPDRPQATPATPRRENQAPLPIPVAEEVVVAQVAPSAYAGPSTVSAPRTNMGRGVQLGVSSGAAGHFLKLLRDPQSMKTAIMLREILDKPISRRGRG